MVMSTFGNGFSGKMVYMSTSGKGFIEKTFSVSTFIDKYSEVRILLRFSDIFVHYNLALFGKINNKNQQTYAFRIFLYIITLRFSDFMLK